MFSKTRNNAVHIGLMHAAAAAFCLVAPFVVFLTANNYSVFAIEVFPVYLAALIVGLLVAVLVRLRLTFLAGLALWGCVVTSVAFLYGLSSLSYVISVAVASAVVLWLLKENAAKVLAIAAVVHVGSTMALYYFDRSPSMSGGATEQKMRSNIVADLPPVVHLVLDEFVGLHGIPGEISNSQELVSKIANYYPEHGFNLFSHAYSQYTDTTNSLANLFNFSSNSESAPYLRGSGNEFAVADNRYFGYLAALGYRLHVYQSDYLSFCETANVPVSSCSTYKDNSIESIANIKIPTTQKSLFILNSFLDSSVFLRSVRYSYHLAGEKLGVAVPPWPTGNSRTGPLAVLPTFARFKAALRELRPGEVHFAHLMLPHYPYILDANCVVKSRVRSWLNNVPFELAGNLGEQNSEDSRSERYLQYLAQVACTHSMIKELMAAIQDSGQWEKAIIIIHGDHGARIVRHNLYVQNLSVLVENDYRDAYSIFFAVKNGATTGTLDRTPLPLQLLLARVWQVPVPQQDAPHVYLQKVDQPELQATPLLGFGSVQLPVEKSVTDTDSVESN